MADDEGLSEKILSQLLALTAGMGELNAKVARLQVHIESQGTNVIAIRDAQATVKVRLGDHTERLAKLEVGHSTHAGWRSRIGGIAIGVMTTVALIGSLVAIWKSMTGK